MVRGEGPRGRQREKCHLSWAISSLIFLRNRTQTSGLNPSICKLLKKKKRLLTDHKTSTPRPALPQPSTHMHNLSLQLLHKFPEHLIPPLPHSTPPNPTQPSPLKAKLPREKHNPFSVLSITLTISVSRDNPSSKPSIKEQPLAGVVATQPDTKRRTLSPSSHSERL